MKIDESDENQLRVACICSFSTAHTLALQGETLRTCRPWGDSWIPEPQRNVSENTATDAEPDAETPKLPKRKPLFVDGRDPDPDEQYVEGPDENWIEKLWVHPDGKFLDLLDECHDEEEGKITYGGKGIIDRKAAPPRRAARRIAT